MKRPPGNLGGLFFQGRIVPTEVLSIRTFCGNLMSLKSTVSSKICDLNSLIFNNLCNTSTSQQTRTKSLLFEANDIRLSHLPLPRHPPGSVFQVQGDDFHGFPAIEHGVGKKPF